jgi:hypothetical protein
MAFICLSVYLPIIWARKKSQKKREGNRRRHLKKTALNCSNAYMRIRYGAKEITALLWLLIVTVQTAILLIKLIVIIAGLKSYWAVFHLAAQLA